MFRLRMHSVFAAAAVLATAGAAEASCGDPKWRFESVSQVLEEATTADIAGEYSRDLPGALRIALAPFTATTLPYAPERPAKNAVSFAAALQFVAGTPGAYRIALSDAAWIDVIQDREYLEPNAFTGNHDCPNLALRKIVEFDIGAGPFTLQLSDATAESIAVAIVPAE